MSEPETLRLELPGLTLAALAWGPPEGVPTLCIHGWLDNAASFSLLAPRLEGLRVVALDLPGHGHSDHRPQGVQYHFIDWVVDVAAAADALGWKRFQLIGHSMGAGIASLVAGALAERVSRLVLFEGLGPLSCPIEEAPARLAKSIRTRAKIGRKTSRVHTTREEAAERLLQVNPALSPDSARRIVERGTREVEGGVTWRSDPRLRGFSPMRMSEEHVIAFLRQVTMPTLMIRAREGYPFDPKGMGTRIKTLKDVRAVELPGGHHLHMDSVEPVAAEVNAFLGPAPAPPWQGGSAPILGGLGVSVEQLAALKGLRLVVLDVDGVLTPGAQVDYGPQGNDRLTFSIRDGMGIKMLQRAGIEVALLSGRDTPPTRARAKDLGITHLCLGVEHKVPRLRELAAEVGVDLAHVAYMGDDINDVPPLRVVGYPTAPADAHAEVLKVARWVSGAPGGAGAVRDLAEHVIKFQGKWEQALAHYRDDV